MRPICLPRKTIIGLTFAALPVAVTPQGIAFAVDTSPAAVIKPCKAVVLTGHRGRVVDYDENTVHAFIDAAKHGADYIEGDIRLTKPFGGERPRFMLMHDQKVDRTTNGTGYIEDLTWKQVRALRTEDNKASTQDGDQVPFVAEILDAIKPRAGVGVRLEIKYSPYWNDVIWADLVGLIKHKGMVHRTVLYTFSSGYLHHIKTAAENAGVHIETAWKAHEAVTVAKVEKTSANGVVARPGGLTRKLVRKLHAAGLTVHGPKSDKPTTWAHQIYTLKVDTVMTNRLDKYNAWCRAR
jgi:glycerophosphoryl diester phosphodiesterase